MKGLFGIGLDRPICRDMTMLLLLLLLMLLAQQIIILRILFASILILALVTLFEADRNPSVADMAVAGEVCSR